MMRHLASVAANKSHARLCEILLLLALCALLAPFSATALLIDDFENGTFSITDTTTTGGLVSNTQGSLAGVLGGSRESSTSLVTGSSSTLALSSGVATATAGSASTAFFLIRYDGIANGLVDATGGFTVDLTQGGVNDRFRLEVSSVIGSTDLTIGVSEPGTSVIGIETFPVSSAGTLEILFADFPATVDFTNVDAIQLQAGGGSGAFANGESFSFGSFEAVPEPGPALLLAGGLAGLAARRSRISRAQPDRAWL